MKNTGIVIISIMLCGILFIAEMLFMTLFNISHGIEKQDIINIVDQVNIKDEVNEINSYKELKQEINPEILDQILMSQEVEKYVKENVKAAYINAIYKENMNYVSSIELKEQVNNIIEQNELPEEQKDKIINILDEITTTIDNEIETINNENLIIQLIRTLLNEKTSKYILIAVIVLSLIILSINKSKTGYLWIGLPTVITGVLFLILTLAIQGKIPETSIDIETKNFIIKYLPNLIKTLKTSSIIMTSLGFISCTLYTILNYQEGSVKDGKI